MAGVAKIAVVPTNFMSTTYSGVGGWVTTWRVTSLRFVPDVTGKSTNENRDTEIVGWNQLDSVMAARFISLRMCA